MVGEIKNGLIAVKPIDVVNMKNESGRPRHILSSVMTFAFRREPVVISQIPKGRSVSKQDDAGAPIVG